MGVADVAMAEVVVAVAAAADAVSSRDVKKLSHPASLCPRRSRKASAGDPNHQGGALCQGTPLSALSTQTGERAERGVPWKRGL